MRCVVTWAKRKGRSHVQSLYDYGMNKINGIVFALVPIGICMCVMEGRRWWYLFIAILSVTYIQYNPYIRANSHVIYLLITCYFHISLITVPCPSPSLPLCPSSIPASSCHAASLAKPSRVSQVHHFPPLHQRLPEKIDEKRKEREKKSAEHTRRHSFSHQIKLTSTQEN